MKYQHEGHTVVLCKAWQIRIWLSQLKKDNQLKKKKTIFISLKTNIEKYYIHIEPIKAFMRTKHGRFYDRAGRVGIRPIWPESEFWLEFLLFYFFLGGWNVMTTGSTLLNFTEETTTKKYLKYQHDTTTISVMLDT